MSEIVLNRFKDYFTVRVEPDDMVVVIANDYEVGDYIDDVLAEKYGLEQVWCKFDPYKMAFELADLDTVKIALSELDLEVLEKISRINS